MLVEEGDILLFTRNAVVRHFDSELNFKQIKSCLTFEEYNAWFNGETDDANFEMSLCPLGLNQIFIAMPGHQCIGILDLELTRIDTFLNPFRGDKSLGEGAVYSIAYDSVDLILYVCTHDDYDLVGQVGPVSIAAYSWPSRELLWRKAPAYERSGSTIGGRAFDASAVWITLSEDRQKLYVTDGGYAVGEFDISNQEMAPLYYFDGTQPTYWSDDINTSYPPTAFPDTTQLVFQPGPPHNFVALTDGTEVPRNIPSFAVLAPTDGGAKINTQALLSYFNPPTNTQGVIVSAQLLIRSTNVAVGSNRLYVLISQRASNQFCHILRYPSAPFIWTIMTSYYSAEPRIDVLNTSGEFVNRYMLPLGNAEESNFNLHGTGYLDSTGPAVDYGTNAPYSCSVDSNYLYAVQIGSVGGGKGAGPLTRINLASGVIEYYGDVELVPRWAIQELNDGLFRESATIPQYKHVLPVTFVTAVTYPGIAKVPQIGTTQEWFVRTTP